ncbi:MULTISPECIES: hypothetical protein [unclassified Novosphingobium]|uniref:hypothetical protein n=1 Tax=unclassified Novosphingobium TaxID=2644732 RepID=UPI001304B139|nr:MULTISPECIES: hypothetical protein [unclassified Novosphingobium]
MAARWVAFLPGAYTARADVSTVAAHTAAVASRVASVVVQPEPDEHPRLVA